MYQQDHRPLTGITLLLMSLPLLPIHYTAVIVCILVLVRSLVTRFGNDTLSLVPSSSAPP